VQAVWVHVAALAVVAAAVVASAVAADVLERASATLRVAMRVEV
jgi:hypothetical protein